MVGEGAHGGQRPLGDTPRCAAGPAPLLNRMQSLVVTAWSGRRGNVVRTSSATSGRETDPTTHRTLPRLASSGTAFHRAILAPRRALTSEKAPTDTSLRN